jgi:hypothetical protein
MIIDLSPNKKLFTLEELNDKSLWSSYFKAYDDFGISHDLILKGVKNEKIRVHPVKNSSVIFIPDIYEYIILRNKINKFFGLKEFRIDKDLKKIFDNYIQKV